MKLSELSAALEAILVVARPLPAQLEKVRLDILAAPGGDPDIPADATAKLVELAAVTTTIATGIQAVDDLVPERV